MKTYTFPYGGSIGHESWDSIIDIELTDEEAERLEASARKESREDLDEDDEIQDIYEKVKEIIFAENKRMMIDDGRLEEARDFYDEDMTDDEVVDEEMGFWDVRYPEELQNLVEEE